MEESTDQEKQGEEAIEEIKYFKISEPELQRLANKIVNSHMAHYVNSDPELLMIKAIVARG